jgi:pilus assembly protein Flp/PilA
MFAKLFRKAGPVLGRLRRDKKGAAMVEYALLIAGVSLIAAAAVSVFGHKVTDLVGTVAVILPGAHTDDNNPIQSGHLIETAKNANGSIAIDTAGILGHNNTSRLDGNVFGDGTNSTLVTETVF